jgi:hypothetical protein
MTAIEFCQNVGLTPRELQNWIETGLIQAELVVIPGAAGGTGSSPPARSSGRASSKRCTPKA